MPKSRPQRPPKHILDFEIPKRGPIDWVVNEVQVAENNYDVVLKAAQDVAARTLLSQFEGGIDIRPLEEMIRRLKVILSLIRREIRKNHPEISFGNRHIANEGAEPPAFPVNDYQNACPMTALLQLIAQKFSKLRLRVRPNDWGSLKPLREVLVRLQHRIRPVRIRDSKKEYYPGIAHCIIFHEEHSVFTVSSTAPRFIMLLGLEELVRKLRYAQINQLKSTCSPSVVKRIGEMVEHCEDFRVHWNVKEDKRTDEWREWKNPFESEGNHAKVNGYGGCFEPSGDYKLACLLDYWRFEMERPKMDEICALTVSCDVEGRGMASTFSCAEWELWVAKISKPPVQPPTPVQPVPVRNGMAKSGTWTNPPQPPATPLPVARRSEMPWPKTSIGHQRPPNPATFPDGPMRGIGRAPPMRMPLPERPSPPKRANQQLKPETQEFYSHGAQYSARPYPGGRNAAVLESASSVSTQTAPNKTPKAKNRSCCGFF